MKSYASLPPILKTGVTNGLLFPSHLRIFARMIPTPQPGLARLESHLPWLLALLAGAVYACTLAPAIGHTDAGELAAVAYTVGVAHPTGYPMFTLLGWLAS